MDFDLTEEQRLLRDSVDRLSADHYAFDKRRGYLAEPEGWSRALWSQYAELGLLGLPFAEEHGGFGGGGIEIMLVMEAFGRALALEPYLATVVLGRHRAAARRQRGAASGDAAAGRRGQAAGLRAWRAPGALRPVRCADDGEAERRRLGARRREKRRLARRQRRQADRQRPHLGRARRHRRHHPVPGRCQGERGRAARLHDARRHPRGRDRAERRRGRARRRARRTRRRLSRSSSASSRPASPRPPPRRSARWRRCRR